MIFLGIDPGTAAIGWGLVQRAGDRLRAVDHGCLQTSADLALPERLNAIHELVVDLLELHEPAIVAVERVFFSRNAQTAIAVGQARGVILLAAAQHGIEVREATPNEIKQAVTGYGSADKEQVGRMVQVILGLSERPQPNDAADALAVAIWAANRERPGERLNAGLLDRAAVAPRAGAETPYERAVREALRTERAAGRARPAPSAADVADPPHPRRKAAAR